MNNITYTDDILPESICSVCGCTNERLYEVDGKLYCADCLETIGYAICDDCDEAVDTCYLSETVDGRYVCNNCAEDYISCENCGKLVRDADAIPVYGGWRNRVLFYICEDCTDDYATCRDCGHYIVDEYSNRVYDSDEVVCDSCREDYSYCEDCGVLMCDYDIVVIDGDYYCRDCARAHDNGRVHDYGYKPLPVFKTRNGELSTDSGLTDFTFGVEVEVDKGPSDEVSDTVAEIEEACDDVYMKHDSSLDTGFEIVTHPCTLDYHMYSFAWRHILSIAQCHGFKSHDARTCGLHVHVGREQLGSNTGERDACAAKLAIIVDRLWEPMVKFSRRTESQLHWARRNELPDLDEHNEHSLVEWILDNYDNRRGHTNERYHAVNLTNVSTVEFRLFNGSLKRDTVIATLQLVNNLLVYATHHSVADCLACQWSDIIDAQHFDELSEYLASRELSAWNEVPAAVLDRQIPEALKNISVGDRVQVVSLREYTNECSDLDASRCSFAEIEVIAGLCGTVCGVNPGSFLPVAVRFDEERPHMHNCGGRCDSFHGYWVPCSAIRVLDNPEAC